jgi:cytoskeleton protein RodZ
MSETHDEPVMSSDSPSIGDRLREAREAKNYTLAEVAAQLRLTKDIIAHMEDQEWDKLNGRTYARGYFANYVKFLGLPYEEMLAVFNLEYSAKEPAINLKHRGQSVNERAFPWFMLALIAIILVVIWLAYQQWQQTQALGQSPATPESQSAAVEDEGFNDSVVEPIQNDSTQQNTRSPQQDEAAPVTQESLSATADALGLSDENLKEINAAEQINSAAGTAAGQQPGMTPLQAESQQQAATETSTLHLSFSEECWVEVTNADAKVLVSKKMQANDSLELSSDKSLSVLLGRATAATVYFNNEQVDLKPYTRGDVARLTLGVES